jgi:hypothetical protein
LAYRHEEIRIKEAPMMSSYTETVERLFREHVDPVVKERDVLLEQQDEIRRRIADEKARIQRVERHRANLVVDARDAALSGGNRLAGFLKAGKKRREEIDDGRENIGLLEEALETNKTQLAEVYRRIEWAITQVCRDVMPSCEAQIAELLDQVVAEYDTWFGVFEDQCGARGLSFSRGKREHCPRLRHSRIDPRRPNLVVPMSTQERLERLNAAQATPPMTTP